MDNKKMTEQTLDDIARYMDNELREKLHFSWTGADDDYQGWYDAYCDLHRAKFGEDFEVN